jgi:hypothetical protein
MSKNEKSPQNKKISGSRRRDPGSSALPGWPGYRTRDGRSGYDPIDTRAEAGHMAGTILRKLFAGKITNRISLFLLGVLGTALMLPLVLTVSEVRNGNVLPWNAWVVSLVAVIAGIALIINFIRNLPGINRQK